MGSGVGVVWEWHGEGCGKDSHKENQLTHYKLQAFPRLSVMDQVQPFSITTTNCINIGGKNLLCNNSFMSLHSSSPFFSLHS